MAKTTSEKPRGLSFHPDDAIVGEGLFGAGPATALKHRFGYFKYPSGNMAGKKVTALLVTFKREEEKHTEPMTVGKGFTPSDDGLTVKSRNEKATGLPSNCKCMHYFRSLLEEGEMTKKQFAELPLDISVIDGIDGELIRKPMEKGEGMSGNPTVLIWDEIESAPWQNGASGTKKKKKAKGKDDDDEDADADEDSDDSEDDDTDDDAPKKKKKKKAADEDEDEDEAPAKKKKAAAADDDDEEETDAADEDDLEVGTEALIEALEDGKIRLANVETSVAGVLKKHKRGKAIAKLMALPKTLKTENGWEFDGKVVTPAS